MSCDQYLCTSTLYVSYVRTCTLVMYIAPVEVQFTSEIYVHVHVHIITFMFFLSLSLSPSLPPSLPPSFSPPRLPPACRASVLPLPEPEWLCQRSHHRRCIRLPQGQYTPEQYFHVCIHVWTPMYCTVYVHVYTSI